MTDAQERTHRGRRRGLLLSVLGAIAVLVVVGEIVARTFLTSPSTQDFDPQLGYVNRPGSTLFQSREGFQTVQLNRLGLNDTEVPPKDGRRRVLVVGDSMTFAAQVPQSANFTGWIERLAPGLDVVNAGRDALGPHQWNTVVDRFRPAVRPNLTVVVMSRGDIFDLHESGAVIVHDAAGRPVDVRAPVSKSDALQARLNPLLQRSALATYLARRAQALDLRLRSENSWFARVVYGPPKPARGEEAPITAATVRDLGEIMSLLQAGGPVVFVSLPSFTYGSGGRIEYEPRSAAEASAYRQAARAAGALLLDLGPVMRTDYERRRRPLAGFPTSRLGEGHLNREGHEVVGRALAPDLTEILAQSSDKAG